MTTRGQKEKFNSYPFMLKKKTYAVIAHKHKWIHTIPRGQTDKASRLEDWKWEWVGECKDKAKEGRGMWMR